MDPTKCMKTGCGQVRGAYVHDADNPDGHEFVELQYGPTKVGNAGKVIGVAIVVAFALFVIAHSQGWLG